MQFSSPSAKLSIIRRMKQKCSSRKVQIDPAVKLLQECLKNYSSGLDRATLTCSNYDDCCALSTDGLVFVLYYIDDKTRVQVQTFFPRTRSLSKSCVQQLLQEDHVELNSTTLTRRDLQHRWSPQYCTIVRFLRVT